MLSNTDKNAYFLCVDKFFCTARICHYTANKM